VQGGVLVDITFLTDGLAVLAAALAWRGRAVPICLWAFERKNLFPIREDVHIYASGIKGLAKAVSTSPRKKVVLALCLATPCHEEAKGALLHLKGLFSAVAKTRKETMQPSIAMRQRNVQSPEAIYRARSVCSPRTAACCTSSTAWSSSPSKHRASARRKSLAARWPLIRS